MMIGAVVAFIVMMATGSLLLAVLAAILAATLLALMFAGLAVSFRANQVAAGLAPTIFGTSLASFIGKSYIGMAIVMEPSSVSAFAARIPLVGAVLGQLHPLVWLSLIFAAGDTGGRGTARCPDPRHHRRPRSRARGGSPQASSPASRQS